MSSIPTRKAVAWSTDKRAGVLKATLGAGQAEGADEVTSDILVYCDIDSGVPIGVVRLDWSESDRLILIETDPPFYLELPTETKVA